MAQLEETKRAQAAAIAAANAAPPANTLLFSFAPTNAGFSVVERLWLQNVFTQDAEFYWTSHSDIFSVTPIKGVVLAGQSVPVEFVYAPKGPHKTLEHDVFLHVKDGPSLKIACRAALEEALVQVVATGAQAAALLRGSSGGGTSASRQQQQQQQENSGGAAANQQQQQQTTATARRSGGGGAGSSSSSSASSAVNFGAVVAGVPTSQTVVLRNQSAVRTVFRVADPVPEGLFVKPSWYGMCMCIRSFVATHANIWHMQTYAEVS